MTLESSFVCLFLTRHIWGSCTLWDSYLLEYSSWCHVLIRAQKLGKGLCLFSSLKSKRKNEGGKGSMPNPSLGRQRWFSRSRLEGTEQELGLRPCKRHAEGLSHGKHVRFQWQPLQKTELFWWIQVGHNSWKSMLFRGTNLLLQWRPPL